MMQRFIRSQSQAVSHRQAIEFYDLVNLSLIMLMHRRILNQNSISRIELLYKLETLPLPFQSAQMPKCTLLLSKVRFHYMFVRHTYVSYIFANSHKPLQGFQSSNTEYFHLTEKLLTSRRIDQKLAILLYSFFLHCIALSI